MGKQFASTVPAPGTTMALPTSPLLNVSAETDSARAPLPMLTDRVTVTTSPLQAAPPSVTMLKDI